MSIPSLSNKKWIIIGGISVTLVLAVILIVSLCCGFSDNKTEVKKEEKELESSVTLDFSFTADGHPKLSLSFGDAKEKSTIVGPDAKKGARDEAKIKAVEAMLLKTKADFISSFEDAPKKPSPAELASLLVEEGDKAADQIKTLHFKLFRGNKPFELSNSLRLRHVSLIKLLNFLQTHSSDEVAKASSVNIIELENDLKDAEWRVQQNAHFHKFINAAFSEVHANVYAKNNDISVCAFAFGTRSAKKNISLRFWNEVMPSVRAIFEVKDVNDNHLNSEQVAMVKELNKKVLNEVAKWAKVTANLKEQIEHYYLLTHFLHEL